MNEGSMFHLFFGCVLSECLSEWFKVSAYCDVNEINS